MRNWILSLAPPKITTNPSFFTLLMKEYKLWKFYFLNVCKESFEKLKD
jgi:hypothetical protein